MGEAIVDHVPNRGARFLDRRHRSPPLSSGQLVNTWCRSLQVQLDVRQQVHSLTEDIERGTRLGRAGKRLDYADEAKMRAVMENRESVTSGQR